MKKRSVPNKNNVKKKFRIRIPKIDVKTILIQLAYSVLLGSILFIMLTALPKTEKIPFLGISRDLNLKDFSAKQYDLLLSTTDKDNAKQHFKEANQVLLKRIKTYKPEYVEITNKKSYEQDDKQYQEISIIIVSSQDLFIYEQLLSSNGQYKILKPKDDKLPDLAFKLQTNSKDISIDSMLPQNYDETEFDYSKMRDILIKKSQFYKDSEGNWAYTAIFKPKLKYKKEFDNFAKENEGKALGWEHDNFVTPFYVFQVNRNSSSASPTVPKVPDLIVPLSTDPNSAKLYNTIYNNPLPVDIEFSSTMDNNNDESSTYPSTRGSELNPDTYIMSTEEMSGFAAFVLTLIGLTILMYTTKSHEKDAAILYFLVASITIALWITYLKISFTPVNTVEIFYTGLLFLIVAKFGLRQYKENLQIIIPTTILTYIASLTTFGFVSIINTNLTVLLLIMIAIYPLIQGLFYWLKGSSNQDNFSKTRENA